MFQTLKNTISSFLTYIFPNYFHKKIYKQNQLIYLQNFSLLLNPQIQSLKRIFRLPIFLKKLTDFDVEQV
mgnify:CR=1 FL=1